MKVVLDTDVTVAAMRSPAAASAAVLRRAREERVVMLANVALALEYEAVCSRPEHARSAGLSRADVNVFVDAVIALAEPVESHFLWRPQLRDPADEMVLEAAVNGGASAIVTFNVEDFGTSAGRFGIAVLTPSAALRRIRS